MSVRVTTSGGIVVKVDAPPAQTVRVGPARDASPAQVSDIDRVLSAIRIDTQERGGFRLTEQRAHGQLAIGLTGQASGIFSITRRVDITRAQLLDLPNTRVEILPQPNSDEVAWLPRGLEIEKSGDGIDANQAIVDAMLGTRANSAAIVIAEAPLAGTTLHWRTPATPGDPTYATHGKYMIGATTGRISGHNFVQAEFLVRDASAYYADGGSAPLTGGLPWSLCWLATSPGTEADRKAQWMALINASPADLALSFLVEYAPRFLGASPPVPVTTMYGTTTIGTTGDPPAPQPSAADFTGGVQSDTRTLVFGTNADIGASEDEARHFWFIYPESIGEHQSLELSLTGAAGPFYSGVGNLESGGANIDISGTGYLVYRTTQPLDMRAGTDWAFRLTP